MENGKNLKLAVSFKNSLKIGFPEAEVTENNLNTELEKELEKEKYFFDENSDYQNINELDISEEIRDLKKRYQEAYNFKKVAKLSSPDVWKPFKKFARDNPSLCKDVVLSRSHFIESYDYGHDDDSPYFDGLTIIHENFVFTLRTNYISDNTNAYLFFNDIKYIKDTFFKKNFTKYKEDIYELSVEKDQYVLHKVDIKHIEEPILEEDIAKKLNSDINLFFENKEFYDKNNLPYKRGIILYGPPGCGKTSSVKKILTQHKDTHRLFVDSGKHFDTCLFDYLKTVFPKESKKIIVFEDVESISDEGSRSSSRRSSFLNFIDGAKTVENTIFIATTNYPDLVDPALINRPSRFDKVYKIDYPSKKCREKFLLRFFPELVQQPKTLAEYVDETKDFSGAYFKELFIMVGVQKTTIKEAIDSLKKQIKMCKNKKFDKESSLGFGRSDED